MSVAPWHGRASAASAAAYMARAQADANWEMARHLQLVLTAPRVDPTPAKCPGCGSHEFRQHYGRIICAYCRTGGR